MSPSFRSHVPSAGLPRGGVEGYRKRREGKCYPKAESSEDQSVQLVGVKLKKFTVKRITALLEAQEKRKGERESRWQAS